jgi:hypothetical protein
MVGNLKCQTTEIWNTVTLLASKICQSM